MMSIMQNHYFTPYSLNNQYPCYNGGLAGGYPMGSYFGYWPWSLNTGVSHVSPVTPVNGSNMDFNHFGGTFGYPQYFNPTYNQWGSYPYTNWINARQIYPQTQMPWQSYQYPYWRNQWNLASGQNGMHYCWPTMNYFQNQIQFPNYSWPSPVYWGVQQLNSYTPDIQQGSTADGMKHEEKETVVLKNSSSDVTHAYHMPSIIARKTVSDIPRSKEYSISLKKSETSTARGESDDILPFLLKIDQSIQQIAPSRSFGPSMVYNTDSDPNGIPSSPQW